MGNLILEVSVKVQCTFNTVVVLRHTVPPLKKIANYGGFTATTAVREPQAIGKDFQATGLEL